MTPLPAAAPARAIDAPAHVVALPGWGLPGLSTRYWRRRLRQAGFGVSSFAYRSLARSLNQNASLLAAAIAGLPGPGPVHLVGHSMGGIVILHMLALHRVQRLGRVVLVGTPFQGSAAADRLARSRPGRFLLGKSMPQWRGVGADELPPGLELGTIAGITPLGVGRLLTQLPLPHDGTVSLAETHVPFATDRLVLPVTHSEMLVSVAVAAQIAAFLRHGAFARR
jgi:pimeloyl-ACP methyl ester carboxylesterase